MLLGKIKPVGLFMLGFLAGSCAVAFAFGVFFFYAALNGALPLWPANGALVRSITNMAGLVCGVAVVWRYSRNEKTICTTP